MQKASLLSKALLVTAVSIAVCSPAWADEYVDGYYRADGTYVQPYWRSDPDGNPYNNYSFPGNLNPYTGTIAPGNPDTYLDNYYDRGGFGGFDFPSFDDGDDD
jgi:hypothetical protein